MAASLRLLGAERRTEAVDLAERGCGRLTVELASLGKVSAAFIEVLRREQPTALPDGTGEDRCIDPHKIPFVEEVVNCLLDLGANSRDGALPRRAEPEVAIIEQKVDAVLFRLDRIIDRAVAVDRHLLHRDLIAAWRARVCPDVTLDIYRRFLGQSTKGIPGLRTYRVLYENRLSDAGSVADDGEGDFSGRSYVSYPSADANGLTGAGG